MVVAGWLVWLLGVPSGARAAQAPDGDRPHRGWHAPLVIRADEPKPIALPPPRVGWYPRRWATRGARIASVISLTSAVAMAGGLVLSDVIGHPDQPGDEGIHPAIATVGIGGFFASVGSTFVVMPLGALAAIHARPRHASLVPVELAGVGLLVAALAILPTAFGYTDRVNHGPMLVFAGALSGSAIGTLVQLGVNRRARRSL